MIFGIQFQINKILNPEINQIIIQSKYTLYFIYNDKFCEGVYN
jgi:hypothetical protein